MDFTTHLFLLLRKAFLTNARGYPCLSKHHQRLAAAAFFNHSVQVGPLIKSVNYALKGLKKWMSGKEADLPLAAFPATAQLVPQSLGLILIISSWNFPFGLALESLIGAIVAGNAVVINPSELALESASVLSSLVHLYLDPTAIKVN